MKISRVVAIMVLATVTFVAGCASNGGSPASQRGISEDARIQYQVEQALKNEPFLLGNIITVSSVDGVVSLHGNVNNGQDIGIAETAAANVEGVVKVNNFLTD